MFFLLSRILFTVTFSHLLRLSQARTPRPLSAAGINYLIAAVATTGWTVAAHVPWNQHTVLLGAITGFLYVVSMVLILPAMRAGGVSVTGAVLQLALMIPVAFAIWRFGEYPNWFQLAGIGLTLVALPLLSAARAAPPLETAPDTEEDSPTRVGRGFALILGVLFVSAGASQVVMKEFAAAHPGSELPLFSAALFSMATLCTYLWMVLARDTGRIPGTPPEGRPIGEWPLGTLLGVVNVLQLIFLVLALRELPAILVFPVSASVGIVCNTVASIVLWNERPSSAGWLGIGLAVAAVVLLNLR
jgi:drug/metabolite transporter (DMT)-like permease